MTAWLVLLPWLLTPLPVPNAGLEEAAANGAAPAGWQITFPDGAQHVWDSTVAHGGQRSLRVSAADAAKLAPNVAAWRCSLPAPGVGEWVLSLWVRGQDLPAGGMVRVRPLNAANEPLGNFGFPTARGTFEWRRQHCRFTLSAETQTIELVLGLQKATGTVWFDDLALHSAASAAEVVGRAEFSPAEALPVKSEQRLSVTWTAGSDGLQPGGSLLIEAPSWREQRNWYQVRELQATCSRAGARLTLQRGRLQNQTWPPAWVGGLASLTLAADSVALRHGDRVTVAWTITTATVLTEGASFEVSVAASADAPANLVGRHRWELAGGPAVRLNVTATPTPLPGAPARVSIAAFDALDNPAAAFSGKVTLSLEGGPSPRPTAVGISPADQGRVRLITQFAQPGIYRVTARCGEVAGRSHPIWVSAANQQGIWFGDLHVHGEASADAVGPQRYTHVYARDCLGLDFAAISDHAALGPPWEPWQRTKQANNAARDVPFYDTINGYELSFRNGHKNVYFPDDDPPFLSGTNTKLLWQQLGGREALTIPHTPNTDSGTALNAQGEKVWTTMDWAPRNEQYQRVVELVQVRSSYEQDARDPSLRVTQGGFKASVQDALAQGHTLGFIGSTDTHDGLPGSKQGWAAVVAPRLERRALWEALRDRHCYATSGARILLRMTLNEAVMGRELTLPRTTPREVRCEVVGTAPLQRIDLIRDGQVLTSASPEGEAATFRAFDDTPLTARRYYYLRVLQRDSQMAWSSPVWVTPRG
ncbi:MAG: CehA/McbA family metallohydrolase [Fimbriimonadaceae bacterium]|nr:CehA/McbA family metallohydrolase [Fimbriimonadaceae bacterium]